jgi:ankyrin repeat protein
VSAVLLQLHDRDEEDDVEKNAPLALYAAEHWVGHAQFENVASRIKGMETLFDPDKPYFAAWCQLHDIDTNPGGSVFYQFTPLAKPDAKTPLYYAARCGFSNLVEQLIVKHPQHVDAIGGYHATPAVAALAGRHFQVAQVLHSNGSSVDSRGYKGVSPLHSAVFYEDLEMVQVLLDYGVDVNAQDDSGDTPLGFASRYAQQGRFNDPRVVRLLLDHDADTNGTLEGGELTPLYQASKLGRTEIVRVLVEYGASIEVKDKEGRTPLDVASGDEIIKLLSEHRAK